MMALKAVVLVSSCALLIILSLFSSTALAGKADMVVLDGHDTIISDKSPASAVNLAEEVVVSVKQQKTDTRPKIKLHSSAKIEEKEKAIQDKKNSNSNKKVDEELTPKIATTPLETRIERLWKNHVVRTVQRVTGSKGGAIKKKNTKLIAKVRTSVGNKGGNKKKLNTKVRTAAIKGGKKKLNTKVRTSTTIGGKVKQAEWPSSVYLKANVRTKGDKRGKKNGGDLSLKTDVRATAITGGNTATKRVSRPLKTSIRAEAAETLTHREMHYEGTTVYPPTCPCMVAKGLTPSECWYYTDDTRTKCKSHLCKANWVCVVGETTGFTCMRKKSFHKIVPNPDGETCTTKDHVSYSYVTYA